MARPRSLSRAAAALAALGAVALLSAVACRSKPPAGDTTPEAGAPSAATTAEDGDSGASGGSEESLVEAGNRFRDAEPKVVVDADGPSDATCSGTAIALAVVVIDKRCAIGSARAKQLRAILERDGGVALPLKQSARTGADGRVTLELLNTGSAPLTLPLSFSAKLPAFTVLAEDEKHSLYELEPPRLEVAPAGADAAADNDRPHFARIVLAPGGVASTTLTINAAVVRVVGRGAGDTCDGGAACTPARLPKGRYTMHVGELLTDVEVGAPARVVVDLP
jgi:hypothetical protein